MQGLPNTRVSDGTWAYTLYRSAKGPFIHALNLEQGFAVCIDLPAGARSADRTARLWSLAYDERGSSLYAVNTALGMVVRVRVDEANPFDYKVTTGTFAPAPAAAGIATEAGVGSVTLTSDGSLLLAGGAGGLSAIRTADLTLAGHYLSSWTFDGLAASPDGSRLYGLSRSKAAIVSIDPRSGATLGQRTVPGATQHPGRRAHQQRPGCCWCGAVAASGRGRWSGGLRGCRRTWTGAWQGLTSGCGSGWTRCRPRRHRRRSPPPTCASGWRWSAGSHSGSSSTPAIWPNWRSCYARPRPAAPSARSCWSSCSPRVSRAPPTAPSTSSAQEPGWTRCCSSATPWSRSTRSSRWTPSRGWRPAPTATTPGWCTAAPSCGTPAATSTRSPRSTSALTRAPLTSPCATSPPKRSTKI